MVDFRSRAEKNADKARHEAEQAEALQEIEAVKSQISELEQRAATATAEVRQELQTEVAAIHDNIAATHAALRAGGDNQGRLLQEFQQSQERRLQLLLGKIDESFSDG